MQISSRILSASDISSIVSRVSADEYAGNVVIESLSRVNGRTTRVKIGTLDSYAHGSRTSASGRHGRWASWQAFRDILTAVFDADPAAVVRTGIAVYRGRDGFRDTFPGTYYHNVGSMMAPANMGSLAV